MGRLEMVKKRNGHFPLPSALSFTGVLLWPYLELPHISSEITLAEDNHKSFQEPVKEPSKVY
jgi:hypothetical protein